MFIHKYLPRVCFLVLIIFINTHLDLKAQNRNWSIGIRSQKSLTFYRENGLSIFYNSDALVSNKVLIGFHYTTSRLGTALGTNAIKQDNIFMSSHYVFRSEKRLNYLAGLNLGWFSADYEEPVFDDLQNQSVITSLDAGLRYHILDDLNAHLSFGYNLITGSGTERPGTLYPFYYQISVLWTLKK